MSAGPEPARTRVEALEKQARYYKEHAADLEREIEILEAENAELRRQKAELKGENY